MSYSNVYRELLQMYNLQHVLDITTSQDNFDFCKAIKLYASLCTMAEMEIDNDPSVQCKDLEMANNGLDLSTMVLNGLLMGVMKHYSHETYFSVQEELKEIIIQKNRNKINENIEPFQLLVEESYR